MTDNALFPPTPAERLAAVARVLDEERSHRVRMLVRYAADAEQMHYWKKRVAQCDEALAHLAALAEGVGG
jgi:hypothetical protein